MPDFPTMSLLLKVTLRLSVVCCLIALQISLIFSNYHVKILIYSCEINQMDNYWKKLTKKCNVFFLQFQSLLGLNSKADFGKSAQEDVMLCKDFYYEFAHCPNYICST